MDQKPIEPALHQGFLEAHVIIVFSTPEN
jgi:hypothetical protein